VCACVCVCVCVLVCFRLGILIFILISSLCGILDRLSMDFFWHIRDEGMWEFGDRTVLIRLISLFLSVCWLEKFLLSHGAFVVLHRSHNVYHV
jgi:hypothetical protein